MSDVANARATYERLYTLASPEVAAYGPFWRFTAETLGAMRDVMQDVGAAIDACRHISDRVWEAPSPWHAALLNFSLIHQGFNRPGDNKPRYLFRGQRNAAWPLATSMERVADRSVAQRNLARYCELLASFRPRTIDSLPEHIQVATAQHYGVPTNLMDFTPDPAVATFFACHHGEPETDASVFCISLHHVLEGGARIILPPPFHNERLYRQRGLFVDCTGFAAETLHANCQEIHFSPDPEFRVIRHGKVIEILPDNPWMDRLIASACNDMDETPTTSDTTNAAWLYRAWQAIGVPEFASNAARATEQIAEWGNAATEMLYWLAFYIDWGNDRELLDTEVLDVIARDNRDLVELFVIVYEWDRQTQHLAGDVRSAQSKANLAREFRAALTRTQTAS